MRTTKRSKVAALAVSLAMIGVAACSSDNNETKPTTAETTGSTTAETTGGSTAETTPPSGGMTVTYDIAADANWEDGTPITWEDFQCTWQASLNTPASISTVGYDVISGVEMGTSDKEAVVTFSKKFAAYKTLFSWLIKKAAVADCNDVTDDFGPDGIKFSGKEWILDSWTAEQIVYKKNPEYKGPRQPKVDKIVIVPAEDGTTALKSGAVDFIFPQAYTGIDQELSDPNVKYDSALGGSYEGLYFQQKSGPFADPIYREAFSKSIDLQGLYDQIYAPFAQGTPLLDCGPIAPGDYCDHDWKNTYDPEGAKKLLEDNGWTMGSDGYWVNKDGETPDVRWMVDTGNTRRENAQEYLIPKLKELGFKVHADNCEATPCVFQTRLPALDYDMAMYISTVAPDPIYLTSSFVCDQIPSEENGNKGQNNVGWCNEEASKDLHAADEEVDPAKRIELVKSALKLMHDDYVMLPTLQFPNIGAYRTDRVANSQGELANYTAFYDWYKWDDVDGDGQIVIGAEQFPTNDCSNPITDCANSSWYIWVVGNPVQPGAFLTTNDLRFEVSDMLASEPVVKTG